MGKRLSPLDHAFLQVEDGENRMQLAGLLAFHGEAPDFAEFQRVIGERVRGLPHFTQRLSGGRSGSFLGLARPRWVDDSAFELSYHVTRTALPAPGGQAEIEAHIENLTAAPLDVRRPLWEIGLVEGLALTGRDDRESPRAVTPAFAISLKIHHCLVDGLSIMDVFTAILGPDSDLPRAPVKSANRLPAPLAAPGLRKLIARPMSSLAGAAAMVGQAPASIFNAGRPGPTRSVSFITVPLADVQEIRRGYDTTVNNIVLAIVSGGLRRYLLRHDALVDTLHAFVPVNARADGARGALGNQIAMTYPVLPVGEAQPDVRVGKVIDSVRRTAASGQAALTSSMVAVLGLAPTPVAAALNRAMQFRAGLFNVTVTNVPGPPEPLHFLGRELQLIVGSTPLTRRHALTVAVLSYNGTFTFMVTSDPHRLPDGKDIAADLQEEFVELQTQAAAKRAVRTPADSDVM
jgi:WS/DGAT/MGAT family acyltransferase